MDPLSSWIARPLEEKLERSSTKEIREVSVFPPLYTPALQTFFTVWIPGQGVRADFAAMVEILIQQLDGQRALCNSFGGFNANGTGQMMRFSNQPPSNGFTNSYTLLKM